MQPGGNEEGTKEILDNTEILKSRDIYVYTYRSGLFLWTLV